MFGGGEEWIDSVGSAFLGYILWKMAWLGVSGFCVGGGTEVDANGYG